MKTYFLISTFIVLGISAWAAPNKEKNIEIGNLKREPVSLDGGFWKASGKENCSCSENENGKTFIINVPDSKSSGHISWSYYSNYKPSLGEGILKISFRAKIENAKTLDENYAWACPFFTLLGHVMTKEGKKYKNFKNIRLPFNSNGWKNYAIEFLVQDNVADLAACFAMKSCAGKIFIDNFKMELAPLSEKAKEKEIRVKIMNGSECKLSYKPRNATPDKPLTKISENEIKKGYIIYVRKNPKDVYPDSIPSRIEVSNGIECQTTPGELEGAWFAIYSLKAIKNMRIKISGLKDEKGNPINGLKIKTFMIKCWPQGSTSITIGKATSYCIAPELLLKKSNIDLPKNFSQNLYFLFEPPKTAKPGTYHGKISLKFDNAMSCKINVSLKIYPFILETPKTDEMVWLAHTTGNFEALAKQNMSLADAATIALKNMKEYGIEGISLGCGYGSQPQFKLIDGKLKLISFPKADDVLKAMKATGMKGPLIIHMGAKLEFHVAKAMGLPSPGIGQYNLVNENVKTEDLKKYFIKALHEIDRFVKERAGNNIDWFYEGVDEPGAHIKRQERSIWQWSCARKAGMKGAAYMWGAFWKKLAPFNNNFINIFSSSMFSDREKSEALLCNAENYKFMLYQYGASGSYDGLPGGLMPSRWGTGFFAYKTKVKGQISWLFNNGKITDYNKLDHFSFYPLVTYVTSDNKLAPTLQWEGIREGIDDYRYAYTLNKYIEKARGIDKTRNLAKEIDEKFQALLAQIPYSPTYRKNDAAMMEFEKEIDNNLISKIRHQIAEWIILLKNNMQEE